MQEMPRGCQGYVNVVRPATEAAGEPLRSSPARARQATQVAFAPAVHAAPPHTDGMNILLGRAAPSQTLPGAGAWVRGPPARVR